MTNLEILAYGKPTPDHPSDLHPGPRYLGPPGASGDKALLAQQYQAFEQYVELLKGARLLRANLTAMEVTYVYRAVTTGFFLAETLIPDQHQPEFKRKADLLAATFQRAFDIPEPAPRAAVAGIAPRIIALLQKIMEAKRATVHPKT